MLSLQLQAELERAATRLKELEETVKTQRRALSSMQQQLSTVSHHFLAHLRFRL
jgi:uncharacterized protein HemX